VTERRRRDGELDPVDGAAQAVGPRSTRPRRARQQRDGAPGSGGGATGTPRVRGAWTTPAVVVRGPDGQIVNGDEPRPARAPGRRRIRPRRIPGASGSVLVTPTLLADAADGREARRRRRQDAPAATVTPLPPRPPAAAAAGSAADDAPAPGLRPVADEAVPTGVPTRGRRSRAVRDVSAGRPTDGPSPSRRPGERSRQRVLRALAALDRDRLAAPDEDAGERRAARLRRIGSGLVAAAVLVLVVVVVYVVFPVRAGLNQRAAAERARERLEVFQRENALLEDEARELRDDERIEELAREMGLVLPGEESYGIYPAPEEPEAPSGSTSTTRPGG
jgi:cell division protein FtsB